MVLIRRIGTARYDKYRRIVPKIYFKMVNWWCARCDCYFYTDIKRYRIETK